MSNLTDKNKSKRKPLGQLSNTLSDSVESLFNTGNSTAKTNLNTEFKKGKTQSNSMNPSEISPFNYEQEDEFTKTLKKALKESMDENSELRNRLMELEALLAAAQDEMEKKDQAILELANALDMQQQAQEEEKIGTQNSRRRSVRQRRSRPSSR